MAYEALQLVVGMALTDPDFRGRLLSSRAQALVGMPLSEEEAAVLVNTRASTLEELSRKLNTWIERRSRRSGRPVPFRTADGGH